MTLRERPYEVQRAPAITKDNVDLTLDAVVYLRIVDPYKANYAVDNPITAMLILAQTTVRSRIGEMTLDETFKNREALNAHVVAVLAQAGQEWGVVCTRYEVKDIDPPATIMQAMKAEAEAERKKRAVILESEGCAQHRAVRITEPCDGCGVRMRIHLCLRSVGADASVSVPLHADRQAQINRAEGEKAAAVLASEAQRDSVINVAAGDADAARSAFSAETERVVAAARAKATATEAVAAALALEHADSAARYALASEYVDAFGKIGGRSTTLLVPADASNVAGLVAQAMAAVDGLRPPARDSTQLS